MHPDQFVLINALKEHVVERSVKELEYHCAVLDEMSLDSTAKIQIHVGGVYGDKDQAIQRFVDRYHALSPSLKRRLIVENDDRLFGLKDCLTLHNMVGIPVLFDSFHHQCLNNGGTLRQGLAKAAETWQKDDGVPMVDYSSQQQGHRVGTHARTIDVPHFRQVLHETRGLDFDMMLEIKDKEKSALKALRVLKEFAVKDAGPEDPALSSPGGV
jgi:UV DNA damage endonuclease